MRPRRGPEAFFWLLPMFGQMIILVFYLTSTSAEGWHMPSMPPCVGESSSQTSIRGGIVIAVFWDFAMNVTHVQGNTQKCPGKKMLKVNYLKSLRDNSWLVSISY